MKRSQVIVACIAAGMIASACISRPEEVARTPSPDNKFDAVHARPATDATVGVADWVYVVHHGEPASGQPFFVADKVDPNLVMRWIGPNSLVVRANTARVFRAERGVHLFERDGRSADIQIVTEIAQPVSP